MFPPQDIDYITRYFEGHPRADIHQALYDRILCKLSYISNSAQRNLYLAEPYNDNDGITEIAANQGEFEDCSSAQSAEKQTDRLESKLFCLAPDGDKEIIKLTVRAIQQALDDPSRAKLLDAHLDALFEAAKIDTTSIPCDADIDIELEKAWCSDFGIIAPGESEPSGRQVGFRPIIREYLEAFIDRKEEQSADALILKAQTLQEAFEKLEAEGKANHKHFPPRARSWATFIQDAISPQNRKARD